MYMPSGKHFLVMVIRYSRLCSSSYPAYGRFVLLVAREIDPLWRITLLDDVWIRRGVRVTGEFVGRSDFARMFIDNVLGLMWLWILSVFRCIALLKI